MNAETLKCWDYLKNEKVWTRCKWTRYKGWIRSKGLDTLQSWTDARDLPTITCPPTTDRGSGNGTWDKLMEWEDEWMEESSFLPNGPIRALAGLTKYAKLFWKFTFFSNKSFHIFLSPGPTPKSPQIHVKPRPIPFHMCLTPTPTHPPAPPPQRMWEVMGIGFMYICLIWGSDRHIRRYIWRYALGNQWYP